MPIYEIVNSETDEIDEVFLSYAALQEHLVAHPQWKQKPSAPAIVSGIAGVTHKNDSGFNDVMQKIAAANPHTPLADTYGSKGIRESKTRDAVKKAKLKN